MALAAFACVSTANAGTSFIVQCDGADKNMGGSQADKAGWHELKDDPIVFPGQPGASHKHSFTGNSTTNAFSTFASLSGKSHSCAQAQDFAAYWQPAIWKNSVEYRPDYMRAYYGRGGAPSGAQLVWPTSGFRMIGDRDSWSCGAGTPGDSPGALNDPYDCTPYLGGDDSHDGLVVRVIFPQCWDGAGTQPSDFHYLPCATGPGEKLIPQIRLGYHVNITGATPQNITLGDAPGQPLNLNQEQLHGDFFDAWNRTTIVNQINACLNTQPNSCLSFFGGKVGDGGTPPAGGAP
jgi:uncharacterized protein DUF1996